MWSRKEYAVEVLEGVKINDGEKKADYIARVKRMRGQKTEEGKRELEIKEFEAIKSKCLTCKNSFCYQYLPNPETRQADPLIVTCKIRKQLGWGEYSGNLVMDCDNNNWKRKCLSCSDYEERT